MTIFSLNLFLNYNRHIPKKSKIVVVFLVIEVMNTKALKKNVSKSEKNASKYHLRLVRGSTIGESDFRKIFCVIGMLK